MNVAVWVQKELYREMEAHFLILQGFQGPVFESRCISGAADASRHDVFGF